MLSFPFSLLLVFLLFVLPLFPFLAAMVVRGGRGGGAGAVWIGGGSVLKQLLQLLDPRKREGQEEKVGIRVKCRRTGTHNWCGLRCAGLAGIWSVLEDTVLVAAVPDCGVCQVPTCVTYCKYLPTEVQVRVKNRSVWRIYKNMPEHAWIMGSSCRLNSRLELRWHLNVLLPASVKQSENDCYLTNNYTSTVWGVIRVIMSD